MPLHQPQSDVAQIGLRLLDDAHIAWTAAASEATQALRSWLDPGYAEDADRYFVYLAALDREAAAAHDLERLLELSAPCRELLAQGARGELG